MNVVLYDHRGGLLQESAPHQTDWRDAQIEMMQESIRELEDALLGWQQIGIGSEQELSRQGIREITRIARIMYLKNPLINRAVEVQRFYVWGLGWSVRANDPLINDVIQEFMDDPKNRAVLTSQQACEINEVALELEGNIFFVFFPNASTGRTLGRLIPPDEIDDIICNPDDKSEPWFYKRVWSLNALDLAGGSVRSGQRTTYYPDWRLPKDAPRPRMIGQGEIEYDQPIYHVKVGGLPGNKLGLTEVYSALDWALAYKDYLTDWAAVVRALAQFAFQFKTNRGPRMVAAVKERIASTISTGAGYETNPPSLPGSTWMSTEGNDLSPMRTAGTRPPPDEARALKLMVAAGVGLPETFLGDADVGNHATAKTLDRPTELRFKGRQTLWTDIWLAILNYVIDWNVRAPDGLLTQYGRVIDNPRTGESTIEMTVDPETGEPYDRHIEITFPDILERDVSERVKALVSAVTLDGKQPAVPALFTPRRTAELMYAAIGLDDVDEELEALFPEGVEDSTDELPLPPDADEALAEAMVALRQAITALSERANGAAT